MSRRLTDVEYKLNYHLASCVAHKYHLKNAKCHSTRLNDIRRDLNIKLAQGTGTTCKDVLRALYAAWLELRLGDHYPECPWAWTLYFDLKDV